MELVKIEGKEISVKEFNGERVMTFKDIDMLHERTDGTAKRNFHENKKKFILGEDYFEMSRKEFSTNFVPNEKIVGNPEMKTILITQSGYLMLIKSFNDDLSWKVQRQLVKLYFKVKEFVKEEQNNIPNEYMMKFVEQTTKMMEQMTATMAVMTNIMSKNTEVNVKSEEIKPKTKREELKELVQKIKKGRLVSGGKFTILYDRIKKDKGIDVRKAARQNLLDWIEKNGYLEECIKTAKLIIAEQEA